jgi:protoporphyrin/coproporphyrin ferrochelatase
MTAHNRYLGRPDYRHGSAARAAVLVVNLGTPDEPTPSAVRRYLAEFLADPRVIELPRWFWLPLLHGVILPFRSRRSAHAYSQVWTERGSPLLSLSQDLTHGLREALDADARPLTVRLAMRYGNPSIRSVLEELHDEGVRRLLVLPLYPQYSATTTAAVFDEVMAALSEWRWMPELRWVVDYWKEPAWLDAVAGSIRQAWQDEPAGGHLLFSFHGIPQRYFRNGDPYHCQCQGSAREIVQRLGLPRERWTLAFQSRVGREEWLRPYTDETVIALARQGVKRLDVVCPGFAVDCLETLEEIAMQNAEAFVKAGGERLRYLPALNAAPSHVAALASAVQQATQGWPEFERPFDSAAAQAVCEAEARHYQAFVDARPAA